MWMCVLTRGVCVPAGILDKGGFTELSATTLKAMCKKFSGSAKVWLKTMEGGLRGPGASEGVKPLLDRALAALPRRKHIKVRGGARCVERGGSPPGHCRGPVG